MALPRRIKGGVCPFREADKRRLYASLWLNLGGLKGTQPFFDRLRHDEEAHVGFVLEIGGALLALRKRACG